MGGTNLPLSPLTSPSRSVTIDLPECRVNSRILWHDSSGQSASSHDVPRQVFSVFMLLLGHVCPRSCFPVMFLPLIFPIFTFFHMFFCLSCFFHFLVIVIILICVSLFLVTFCFCFRSLCFSFFRHFCHVKFWSRFGHLFLWSIFWSFC